MSDRRVTCDPVFGWPAGRDGPYIPYPEPPSGSSRGEPDRPRPWEMDPALLELASRPEPSRP